MRVSQYCIHSSETMQETNNILEIKGDGYIPVVGNLGICIQPARDWVPYCSVVWHCMELRVTLSEDPMVTPPH